MTLREIRAVSWACLALGWLFLLIASRPDIALCFLLIGSGGFVWEMYKRRVGNGRE